MAPYLLTILIHGDISPLASSTSLHLVRNRLMNASPTSQHEGHAALQILVVEDNHDTREMVCELLRILGHAPQEAATAEEALTVAQQYSFDILITDISLPGMSGIELAKNVARGQPALHIILATGYQIEKQDLDGFECEILVKPYDLEQLQAALDLTRKSR